MNKSSGMDLRCEKAGVAAMDGTDDTVWSDRCTELDTVKVSGLQSEIHIGFRSILALFVY